ncbi:DUF4492 domain-containing protein [Helicobacter sp. T3_23-1059]
MTFLKNIFIFYVDGFRNMTLGRVLWAVIAIKLIIMFGVLKVFVYDTSLATLGTSEAKSQFVLGNLTQQSDFTHTGDKNMPATNAHFKTPAPNTNTTADTAQLNQSKIQPKSHDTAHINDINPTHTNPTNFTNPTQKE